jgi:hypothetical protein
MIAEKPKPKRPISGAPKYVHTMECQTEQPGGGGRTSEGASVAGSYFERLMKETQSREAGAAYTGKVMIFIQTIINYCSCFKEEYTDCFAYLYSPAFVV